MSDFDVVTGPPPLLPARVTDELAAQQVPLQGERPGLPPPPHPQRESKLKLPR